MFKLAQKRQITWPVTVNIPQDGGKTQKATFDGEFEVLTQDESERAIREEKDLLEVQLIGWDGVKDEKGEPVPFSEAAKKQLLDISYVRMAVFAAIGEFNSGRAAARKNG